MEHMENLEYIQEHIHQLFSKNIVLMHEIKRVLDINDIYQTSSLNIMIKRECDVAATEFYLMHVKYTEKADSFDFKLESQELQESFWNYYKELFGESDNIPIRHTLKPRRSH